ncbi:efflux RND transporter permease subunit [Neoroseomonas oryzicola]|uniref:Efflux pump membrane transporter n=1 Tax=Neoroseomonas oryzicola TaxID=535904 RepID=A0A9X9WMN0_9PROT|nr:multidrug efflux RND transporter permease subunit [Neoroseomonas oryzicola]MBR0661590.1 multidrug efflux RND transporter permease subunit [Neoroseomonas oryzicola]NKE16916.1 multidrug efflux RND transporter permease subunit [Neoroseomonas oryzicola]
MSRFFIERPVLANVLAIVLVVIGAVSLFRLPVSEYPNIVPPTVMVTANYPGATAQTVIDTVALPIENQVNGVDGMIYMSSTSAPDGTYRLTVTFEIGTNPDTAQVLVQNRVSLALASLPQSVQAQGVSVQKKSTAILQMVTLDSADDRFDSAFLSNYATINLVNVLSRLPGVGNVNVFGAGRYAMRIWLDPEKLLSFGLDPADVIRAIRQQNQVIAAGQVGTPPAPASQQFQYTLDVQSRLSEPEEFGSIVVKDETRQGGRVVYLRDVARIELGAQNYAQEFRLNGRRAAGIAIYQTPEANSLQVGQQVRRTMEDLSRRFPEGLRFGIPYDTTTFVNDSINEVYTTLYQAGLLVLVVILVFLQNFRATLVPATTVPVTIIGAFAGMAALGFSVNLTTLFGIVLAIGIVVDDAIVIVEGVTKHIEGGKPAREAAIEAMRELFGPIIGITLVLMSVFLPAAFVPGLTGQMFAQFALVIAATALISAINAATLKPTQCAMWLRMPVPPEKRNVAYRAFNRVYDAFERWYVSVIARMVHFSGVMVIAAMVVAGGALWGLTRIPTGFIPVDDQGYLMLAVDLPEGAALGRTTATLEQAQRIARSIPGVEQVITISGVSLLDNSADLASSGAAWVVLKPFAERNRHPDQGLLPIYQRMQRELAALQDGRAVVLPPPAVQGIGNSGGFQMQLELLGGSFDYRKLEELTRQITERASREPSIRSAITTFRANAPQVTITVDRARAEQLRVPVGDVFSMLTDFVGSSYVNQFNKFGQSLQVYVQADSRFRLNPDDLLTLNVRSQDGQMVPLGAVATLGQAVGPPLVTLYNLYASSTIVGSPAPGYSSGQAMEAMERVAREVLPRDVSFEWTAMSYQEKVTGNTLVYVFALSLLLVYLCLAGQYESWILPFSVLSAVPLALVGPVVALSAVGAANNLYVQIGLMLLIALSAKNGILIVEVAREERLLKGKSIIEAAVEASKMRLRPILMTSFAFILGVLPLVLATGAGANARKSLGISVFSGMIASTCLAVLFVPSFFVVLQRFDEWRARRKAGPAPAQPPEAPSTTPG